MIATMRARHHAILRCARPWAALVCMALALRAVSAAETGPSAEPPKEPDIDKSGTIVQKIVHRLNPQVYLIPPWAADAKSARISAPPAGSTGKMRPSISYNGGPVMTSVNAIYVVWYGNWNQNNGSDTPSGQQIILDALHGLAQSVSAPYTNYAGITTGSSQTLGAYTQSGNGKVSQFSSATVYAYTDSYSQGRSLSDSAVLKVVKNAMAKGGNAWSTANPNAVYLVLTSSDVNESSGFCTVYCAWHTYSTSFDSARTPVKFGFVGNANRCLNACSVQSTSPNGNAGVDAMVSTIAHELEESATDPLLNAWYDANGSENADKCAWTYGQSLQRTNFGAYYNATLPAGGGLRNYLLQRALAPSNSKCYVDATTLAQ